MAGLVFTFLFWWHVEFFDNVKLFKLSLTGWHKSNEDFFSAIEMVFVS